MDDGGFFSSASAAAHTTRKARDPRGAYLEIPAWVLLEPKSGNRKLSEKHRNAKWPKTENRKPKTEAPPERSLKVLKIISRFGFKNTGGDTGKRRNCAVAFFFLLHLIFRRKTKPQTGASPFGLLPSVGPWFFSFFAFCSHILNSH